MSLVVVAHIVSFKYFGINSYILLSYLFFAFNVLLPFLTAERKKNEQRTTNNKRKIQSKNIMAN